MQYVLKQLNAWKTFGGTVFKYSHASAATATEMKFCVFVPPNASKAKPVPVCMCVCVCVWVNVGWVSSVLTSCCGMTCDRLCIGCRV